MEGLIPSHYTEDEAGALEKERGGGAQASSLSVTMPQQKGGGDDNKAFLCGMDLLGAQVRTDDFMVAGDCTQAMYGLCESLYKPDLEADDLFEVLAQCLLSGVDRDCLAGWGCTVHVLTPTGLTTRHLKGRMD